METLALEDRRRRGLNSEEESDGVMLELRWSVGVVK